MTINAGIIPDPEIQAYNLERDSKIINLSLLLIRIVGMDADQILNNRISMNSVANNRNLSRKKKSAF